MASLGARRPGGSYSCDMDRVAMYALLKGVFFKSVRPAVFTVHWHGADSCTHECMIVYS